MNHKWRNFFYVLLLLSTVFSQTASVYAEAEREEPAVSAPEYVLMEAETGTVIAQKEKDVRRSPASVTKIMTLLLIFDQLENGSLKMEEKVITSAYAKSMGGSQVFLEEGEEQTVETMIKCIVIASGNDASVAMAEHISGNEQEFVKEMNKRAAGLGMNNTHFEDCCGLTDSDGHYTTAYDIALMSRELINKYPQILKYSSVWMDTILHTTRQGTKEFGLSNTNRLLRTYNGCVGLKTGSTSKAKFCLSAVAQRNGITMIAVVMAAPDSKSRIKDASALLDQGFSKCRLYKDDAPVKLPEISVKKGKEKTVSLVYEKQFRYLSTDGVGIENIRKKLKLPKSVEAPVKKGQRAGEIIYSQGRKEIGRISVVYENSVPKAGYMDCLKNVTEIFCF